MIIEIDEHEELTLYEVDGRHGELQIDLVYRGEIEKLSVGLMQFYLENSAVRLLLTPGHVQAVRSPAGQTEVREEKGERERAGLQATAVLFEPLISFNAGGIGLPFIRHPLLPPIDNLYAGRKGGLNKQLEEVRLEKSREYKRAAKQKRISRWQKIAGGSVFLGSVALGVFWEWAALRDQWIIPGMEKGRDVVMTLKEKGGEYGRYVFELPGVQSITSLVEDRVGEASKIFERYWQDGKRVLDQGITYLFPRGCGQRGFSVFKQDGHFVSYGAVNGRRFDKLMVDTGATLVAISAEVARKSGLDYYREIGDEGQCKTANGNSVCYRLDNIPVSLGCLPVRRVGVSVIEGMQGDEVLLGMSYLTQFFFASDGTVLNIKNQ
ncbi:MAG: retropepsin-like aspartic protease family protein [Endozoicomonas sp.]